MSRTGVARTPNGRRSEQRQRTALVAFRLLPEEHQQLVNAARERGMSMSDFLRTSVLHAASIEPAG